MFIIYPVIINISIVQLVKLYLTKSYYYYHYYYYFFIYKTIILKLINLFRIFILYLNCIILIEIINREKNNF